ncbi:MAG: hypothetical protein V4693_04805 [Pseudomonadota bacterium]
MLSLDRAKWLLARCTEWWQAARRTREKLRHEALQRARAEQRALSLLIGLLDPEQRREFQSHGYFHVIGGSTGDRYRIRLDSAVNIDVLGEHGIVRYHLCARPNGNLPMYDVMAAQLLHLQDSGAELRFLSQANRHVTLSFAAMGRWQER